MIVQLFFNNTMTMFAKGDHCYNIMDYPSAVEYLNVRG